MNIHHSPHPRCEIIDRSVPENILAGLSATGDRAALVDDTNGVTYSGDELVERIRARSRWLASLGVEHGNVVVLAAPTGVAWIETAVGALRLGATVMTANPAVPPDLVRPQATMASARLVVATDADRDWAGAVAGATQVAFLDDSVDGIHDDAVDIGVESIDTDQTAFLLSSSGTSGPPKLAMIPHSSLTASMRIVPAAIGIEPDDVMLLALPLFHAGGLSVALTSLAAGCRLVTQAGFHPHHFAAAASRYRATATVIVPPIAAALAHLPGIEEMDLSALRLVLSTAAPLPPAIETMLGERLGCEVGQGLGMTEVLPISLTVPGRAKAVGSSGPAVPNTELRLVDPETGSDVGEGEAGELWVRGPQVMAGYLGDDAATAACMPGDGWLRTGDLCRIDERGDVFVVDRLKEMIKVSGYQVAPATVEAALMAHPAVRDCAVIGMPDYRRGEVPAAFIVADENIDTDALIDDTATRTPPYARLHTVAVVDTIPRSPTGKILRRMLKGDGSRPAVPSRV